MMKVKELEKVLENIVPANLKESYDNVGLMVGDREAEVNKILLALDCTLDVIEEGKKENVDIIITHHPLLFKKPSTITTDTLLGKKIIELIKNNINLYSLHTNLDSVQNGMNDTIVSLLGFKSSKIIEKSSQDENAGIGRIVNLDKEITLKDVIDIVKDKLKIKDLRYAGNLEKKIKTIAIINGSGQDFFNKAKYLGADCIITGDTTYHFVSDFKEMKIGIIDIGHFGSEWITFLEVAKNLIIKELKDKDSNLEFLISKKTKDPYNFI